MNAYTKLARLSIRSFIEDGVVLSVAELNQDDWPVELMAGRAGAFVTLHIDGDLRGCIGTIGPTEATLAEEIIQNAIKAATEDPRFPAVGEDELDKLSYGVDVLKEPEPVRNRAELDVERYGVIVTSGRRRGLLLPNLEGVDTVDDQLSIALRKAGINPHERYAIERFMVERHGEDETIL